MRKGREIARNGRNIAQNGREKKSVPLRLEILCEPLYSATGFCWSSLGWLHPSHLVLDWIYLDLIPAAPWMVLRDSNKKSRLAGNMINMSCITWLRVLNFSIIYHVNVWIGATGTYQASSSSASIWTNWASGRGSSCSCTRLCVFVCACVLCPCKLFVTKLFWVIPWTCVMGGHRHFADPKDGHHVPGNAHVAYLQFNFSYVWSCLMALWMLIYSMTCFFETS